MDKMDQAWILIGWPLIHIVGGLFVMCLCRHGRTNAND